MVKLYVNLMDIIKFNDDALCICYLWIKFVIFLVVGYPVHVVIPSLIHVGIW